MIKCGPDECPIVAFSDLTPAEQRVQRKRTAESMYKRKFSMEQIAKQLGVTHATISNDLREFVNDLQTQPRTSKRGRKGEGRPKSGGKRPASRPKSAPEKREQAASLFLDKNLTREEVKAQIGLGEHAVQLAVEFERGKRAAEPTITPEMLSMSAQQKLDTAIRQHQRKLDLKFDQRLHTEIEKRIDGVILPHWKQQIEQAKELYTRRRALMDKDTFNVIRRALHPDSRQSISDHKLGEAFDTFMSLEKYLINEKDSPTTFERPDGSGLPSSLAEWDRMRTRPNTRRAASLRVRQ